MLYLFLLDAMWLPLTRLVALDGALPVSGVSQGHITMLPDHKPAKVLSVGIC